MKKLIMLIVFVISLYSQLIFANDKIVREIKGVECDVTYYGDRKEIKKIP